MRWLSLSYARTADGTAARIFRGFRFFRRSGWKKGTVPNSSSRAPRGRSIQFQGWSSGGFSGSPQTKAHGPVPHALRQGSPGNALPQILSLSSVCSHECRDPGTRSGPPLKRPYPGQSRHPVPAHSTDADTDTVSLPVPPLLRGCLTVRYSFPVLQMDVIDG